MLFVVLGVAVVHRHRGVSGQRHDVFRRVPGNFVEVHAEAPELMDDGPLVVLEVIVGAAGVPGHDEGVGQIVRRHRERMRLRFPGLSGQPRRLVVDQVGTRDV